jgi:hypothetical protein
MYTLANRFINTERVIIGLGEPCYSYLKTLMKEQKELIYDLLFTLVQDRHVRANSCHIFTSQFLYEKWPA